MGHSAGSQPHALARRKKAEHHCETVQSTTPSNELTALTNRLVFALGVTDVRFDLSIFGDFLRDIPRRLGRNEALDASVRALTTAIPAVYAQKHSPEMLLRYVEAIRSLSDYLKDSVKATSPDTLCAVYMVMICQVIMPPYTIR